MNATRTARYFLIAPSAIANSDGIGGVIEKALQKTGFHSVSSENATQYGTPIAENVLRSIERADLIIADLTGRNPNVMYELGFAHALRKPVLFILQEFLELPVEASVLYHLFPGVPVLGEVRLFSHLRHRHEHHLRAFCSRVVPAHVPGDAAGPGLVVHGDDAPALPRVVLRSKKDGFTPSAQLFAEDWSHLEKGQQQWQEHR